MAYSLSNESQLNTSAGDRKVDSKFMFAEYAISLEPVVKEKYKEKISVIGIDHFSFRCRNVSKNVCLKLKPVIYYLTSFLTQATTQIRSLTLFRLGSFGTILARGHIWAHCAPPPLLLLYLWSNYNQTWHDGTLGQNLSKAIKILLTSSLGGEYDVIKPCLISFQVKIQVPLFLVQWS